MNDIVFVKIAESKNYLYEAIEIFCKIAIFCCFKVRLECTWSKFHHNTVVNVMTYYILMINIFNFIVMIMFELVIDLDYIWVVKTPQK